jgi:hypothetical protein
MGAQVSTSINTSIQRSTNDFIQSSKNSCTTVAKNNVNNVVFMIDTSNLGTVGIKQTASTNSACIFSTNLDAVSKNIFSTVNQAGSETRLLQLGVAVNTSVNYSEQDIKTAITQSIDNLCSAQSTNNTTNIVFGITNSNVEEAIIEQNADATAACLITNLAKIDALNQLQADNTAAATPYSRGKLLIILAVVGGIILLTTSVLGIIPSVVGAKKNGDCDATSCAGTIGVEYDTCKIDYPTACAPPALPPPLTPVPAVAPVSAPAPSI